MNPALLAQSGRGAEGTSLGGYGSAGQRYGCTCRATTTGCRASLQSGCGVTSAYSSAEGATMDRSSVCSGPCSSGRSTATSCPRNGGLNTSVVTSAWTDPPDQGRNPTRRTELLGRLKGIKPDGFARLPLSQRAIPATPGSAQRRHQQTPNLANTIRNRGGI